MRKQKKIPKMLGSGLQRVFRPKPASTVKERKNASAKFRQAPQDFNREPALGAGGRKQTKAKARDGVLERISPAAGARNKGKKAGIRRTKPRTEKHPVFSQRKAA